MSEDQISEAYNELEDLALRLLADSWNMQGSKPRLFRGQIPSNLPVEIPIPEQSRVVGTLVRSEEEITIVLTSDLQTKALLNFYRERLPALGWNELEDEVSSGAGFLHNRVTSDDNLTFCHSSLGAGLSLTIKPIEGTAIDVRLRLHLGNEGNPCGPQQMRMRHQVYQSNIPQIIPTLLPPSGAQQSGEGASWGTNESNTRATLKTTLPIEVILQHYANLLKQAGWTQLAEGINGPTAWNSWQFTDEDQQAWHGLFLILKTPEKQEDYFIFIRATWHHPESGSKHPGWLQSSGFTLKDNSAQG